MRKTQEPPGPGREHPNQQRKNGIKVFIRGQLITPDVERFWKETGS